MAKKPNNLLDAAEQGNLKAVKQLLAVRAAVNVTDDPQREHCQKVKDAIRYDGTAEGFRLARTALHLAAKRGHTDIINELINAGADIDVQDYLGLTPLMLAIQATKSTAARKLILEGADLALSNIEGQTALHLAAQVGDLHTLNVLIEEKAKLFANNAAGQTPLDLAAQAGHTAVVAAFVSKFRISSHPPLTSAIAYAIASLHPPKKTGEHRPLADSKLKEMLRLLLSVGADPNGYTVNGETALHGAVANGVGLDLVKELIEAGADVNARKRPYATNGQTVMWSAVHGVIQGHGCAALKLLLERGADANTPESHGGTPLKLAKSQIGTFQQIFAEPGRASFGTLHRKEAEKRTRDLEEAVRLLTSAK